MLLLRQELFFQCHLCCKYGSSGMSIAQFLNYPVIREKTLCSCIHLMLGPRGNNFFSCRESRCFPQLVSGNIKTQGKQVFCYILGLLLQH